MTVVSKVSEVSGVDFNIKFTLSFDWAILGSNPRMTYKFCHPEGVKRPKDPAFLKYNKLDSSPSAQNDVSVRHPEPNCNFGVKELFKCFRDSSALRIAE